jgi:hypothetical protein
LSISSIIQEELKRTNKSRIQWLVIDNLSDLSDLCVKDKSSIKEKINGKFNENELESISHISIDYSAKKMRRKKKLSKQFKCVLKVRFTRYIRTIQRIEE